MSSRVKEEGRGRWSVYLDPGLRQPARIAAAQRDITVGELLEAALKAFLAKPVTRPS